METRKIWKFDNNVNTDQIIGSQYLLLPTVEEMKAHAFESLIPDFYKRFRPGDVIVAGHNFGCGSSREQAPRVLMELGVGAMIGKSFDRIFFRNSINIGLPLIQCSDVYDDAENGETLTHSIAEGTVKCRGRQHVFTRFPEHLLKIFRAGGLINYINSI